MAVMTRSKTGPNKTPAEIPPRKRKATVAPQSEPKKRSKTARATKAQEKKTAFLSLPADLRNEIYSLVLGEDQIIPVRGRNQQIRHKRSQIENKPSRRWREPRILLVCKSIRGEASQLYYTSNNREVSAKLQDFEKMSQWVRAVATRCGPKPFKHFNRYITAPTWDEVSHVKSPQHVVLRDRP